MSPFTSSAVALRLHSLTQVRLEAISGEILPTCEKIRYICSTGEASLAEETRSVPLLLFLKKATVRYFPLGVIGCIVPGNFPFHNAVSHITTAIFGGNAAVVIGVLISQFCSSKALVFCPTPPSPPLSVSNSKFTGQGE